MLFDWCLYCRMNELLTKKLIFFMSIEKIMYQMSKVGKHPMNST